MQRLWANFHQGSVDVVNCRVPPDRASSKKSCAVTTTAAATLRRNDSGTSSAAGHRFSERIATVRPLPVSTSHRPVSVKRNRDPSSPFKPPFVSFVKPEIRAKTPGQKAPGFAISCSFWIFWAKAIRSFSTQHFRAKGIAMRWYCPKSHLLPVSALRVPYLTISQWRLTYICTSIYTSICLPQTIYWLRLLQNCAWTFLVHEHVKDCKSTPKHGPDILFSSFQGHSQHATTRACAIRHGILIADTQGFRIHDGLGTSGQAVRAPEARQPPETLKL